ncbi:MAG: hypothetical protein AB1648_06545 [Pseudomonadota bacterium]
MVGFSSVLIRIPVIRSPVEIAEGLRHRAKRRPIAGAEILETVPIVVWSGGTVYLEFGKRLRVRTVAKESRYHPCCD